jgi:hypothetical protein
MASRTMRRVIAVVVPTCLIVGAGSVACVVTPALADRSGPAVGSSGIGVVHASDGPPPIRGRAGHDGSIRLQLGYVRLVAPPGALHPQERVRISLSETPVEGTGAPFQFSGEHRLARRPVQVTVQLFDRGRAGQPTLLVYKATGNIWRAAVGRVNRGGQTASIRTRRLTTWAALSPGRLVKAELTRAAKANAGSPCDGRDAAVLVKAPVNSPISVCVKFKTDRSHEQAVFQNLGGSTLRLTGLTGGLRWPATPDEYFNVHEGLLVQQGILPGHESLHLPYDASVPESTLSFHRDAFETFKNDLAPVLITRIAAGLSASVAAAFRQRYEGCLQSQRTQNIATSLGCMLSAAGSIVNLGGVRFIKNTYELLKAAATRSTIQQVTSRSGDGTITLLSASSLPDAGSERAGGDFHVYGTCADGACGLKVRSAPRYSGDRYPIGVKYDGDPVRIACQLTGESVGPSPNSGVSSAIWDRLVGGGWVSDLYVDTPGTGSYSEGLPRC